MRQYLPTNLSLMLTLFLLALPLSGCISAISGVSGTALIHTAFPRLTVTANPPLALQGYGRQWVSLPTDILGMDPSGIMDYAVYGEAHEGPITRHAHAMVVRPSNTSMWYFQPESYGVPGAVASGRKIFDGHTWTTHVLRVESATDWFSSMWTASGRDTPEFWIARRFSETPERATRVVAEYREPWPECLDPEVKDLLFVRKSCLEGFFERADAAFTLDMHTPETIETPAVPSELHKPGFAPNMRRLAGELRQEDNSFFRQW